MFYSLSISTLLHVLAIPFAAAQDQTKVTTDQLYANLVSTTAAPAPGFNVEGGSVFTNYVNAFNNKQLFYLGTGGMVYEKPESAPVQGALLYWCSDLTFSDLSNSSLIGYAGHCLGMFLAGYAEALAAGDQSTHNYSGGGFGSTLGISAVFVEHQNVFECQRHKNTDDLVFRYWDSGMKTMPLIAWEGHDEGDMSPKAATSSLSSFGEITWMTVEEVAQLFNTSVDEFTPTKFKQAYLNTWIKDHKFEAAEKNPNSEAELEIIDEVKGETESTDETTSTAAPPGTGGTDTSTPVDDDSSSGRKLASITARFVSAALRVFGI